MDKEYLKTLQGASKSNIDANLIIALLEQPDCSFNREIIELYVSELQKGTEYNLKQELAEELIRGEWNIYAKVDGKESLFQLVPIDELNSVKELLNKISDFLDLPTNGEVCANLAQTSSDTFETDIVPEYMSSEDEFLSSVKIDFDDSMLEKN